MMKRDHKRTYRRTAHGFLAVLLLIFGFSASGFGQTSEASEETAVKVPEDAMRQVVQRILVWYFKPRSSPTKIYIHEAGVKKEWLPKIKNIDFIPVSADESKERENTYFFRKPEFSKGTYEIGFAFGDPHCYYSGESWLFRVSKQRIRLWKASGRGFGGGCGIALETVKRRWF